MTWPVRVATNSSSCDQPLADLRLAQRVAVGDRRVGGVEADEEAVLSQPVDDALDDARRQQVAQAEVDDDDVLGRVGRPMHLDEEAGGRDLAQRLGDRREAALGGEPLEHVQRPLVDREHERLAVVAARDPLLQDLGIGAGVGVGDDPRAERLQLRPQPLDQMGLAVAGVARSRRSGDRPRPARRGSRRRRDRRGSTPTRRR